MKRWTLSSRGCVSGWTEVELQRAADDGDEGDEVEAGGDDALAGRQGSHRRSI
jgi:hypothetical protein